MAVASMLLGTVLIDTASAVVLQCGATITQNTTLDADVGPCPGIGIIVGADNITLNLNGHRVFGDGVPSNRPVTLGDYGIYLPGVTGVRVVNGQVDHFDAGIYIEFGGGNTVESVRAIDNIGPINGSGFWGSGIQIFESDDNVINRNQLVHNGTIAGLDVYDSWGTRITNNTVADNNILEINSVHAGGRPFQQDIGIFLVTLTERRTRNSVVTDNKVSGNGLDGISVGNFTLNNQVLRNTVSGNGFGQVDQVFRDGSGIRVGSSSNDNLVQFNTSANNAADGIAVVNGQRNQLRNNRAIGNDQGPNRGILNFDLFDSNPNCDANVWVANQFGTRNQPCIN